MDRYSRHITLSEIGHKGQEKLSKSKVLVVGAGGLGCPVLQYLAAAGIGTLGIIDYDSVELSNLQRQILFGTSSLGKNKANEAKAKLQDLNQTINIIAYPVQLTFQNAIELFGQFDIIVDGTDNFETRYLINDTCVITNKALVFGAIYKFQGQLAVFNYNNGPSYRCAFPDKPEQGDMPNCSEVGVLGVLPGVIGTMMANEVLKIVLGIGNILSGEMLCYDALSNQIQIIKINRNEAEIESVILNKNNFPNQKMKNICSREDIEVSIEAFLKQQNVQFIDVRERHEQPKINNFNVIEIPLSVLENQLDLISRVDEKAIFCQSGIRSKTAVTILKKHHINNCYSIKEGASEIIGYINKFNKNAIHE